MGTGRHSPPRVSMGEHHGRKRPIVDWIGVASCGACKGRAGLIGI